MTEKLRVYCIFHEETAVAKNKVECEANKSRPYLKHKVILATAEDQAQSISLILSKFCDKYNAQASLAEEQKLDPSRLLLQLESTVIKPNFKPITSYVSDYNDVNVIFAAPEVSVQHEEGSVACTNFGCGKRFVPGRDDGPTSCHFHKGKPVFHDTYKYWSCCPEKKSMEFSEFEKVEPCAVGAHINDPMVAAIAVSGGGGTTGAPPENKPLTEEEIKALEAANAPQVAAATAASAASASAGSGGEGEVAPVRGPREFVAGTSQEQKPDAEGRFNCRRHGCGKKFKQEDNNETACSYHTGGPVFHDTYKYWSCCKEKKSTEFDEFAKVPGCAVGEHLK